MPSLTRTVRPTAEPVTTPEVCRFLRMVENPDGSYDDAEIAEALGQAARETVESLAARTLMPTTWALTLDGFPNGGGIMGRAARRSGDPFAFLATAADEIRLPRPPLIEVVAVTYRDASNALVTLDPARYRIIGGTEGPARLALFGSVPWPVTFAGPGAVTITYRAGYADPAEIPKSARTAIRMLAKYWYETEGDAAGVPDYVSALVENCAWGGALG